MNEDEIIVLLLLLGLVDCVFFFSVSVFFFSFLFSSFQKSRSLRYF